MRVRCLPELLLIAVLALIPQPRLGDYEVQISREQHDRFIKAARVWQPPQSDDILSTDPNRGKIIERLDCEALAFKFPGGKSPKFLCAVMDSHGAATKDVVKVKYGAKNSEIAAETAGEKLFRHLGFGGDHMEIIQTLVCYGSDCPKGDKPSTPIQPLPTRGAYEILNWVAIERRMEGHELIVGETQGFTISELASVPRAGEEKSQADALFLLMAFVDHSDSKPDNQRLMCLPGQMDEATKECKAPFAMVHDAGTFFGSGVFREKLKLSAWRSVKVFSRKDCTVQVQSNWAYNDFPRIRISEEGRQFLLSRLKAMVDSPGHSQVRNLFASAHMEMDPKSTIDDWVKAFADKVTEIENAGPCDHGAF